jgi:hypothetical protein
LAAAVSAPSDHRPDIITPSQKPASDAAGDIERTLGSRQFSAASLEGAFA